MSGFLRSPRLGGLVALLLWLLLMVGLATFVVRNSPPPPAEVLVGAPRQVGPTPTPTIVTLGVVPRDAALRFAGLQATAIPPTLTPVATLEPTATPAPVTPAPTAFLRTPAPAAATPTPVIPTPTPPDVRGIVFSTATPLPGSLPTPMIDPVQAARIGLAPCACTGPDLNCEDFTDVFGPGAAAQACFEECRRLVGGDPFGLDSDGDLYACTYKP